MWSPITSNKVCSMSEPASSQRTPEDLSNLPATGTEKEVRESLYMALTESAVLTSCMNDRRSRQLFFSLFWRLSKSRLSSRLRSCCPFVPERKRVKDMSKIKIGCRSVVTVADHAYRFASQATQSPQP